MTSFVIFIFVFLSIIVTTAQAGLTVQTRPLALEVKGLLINSHVDRRQYLQARRERYEDKDDYYDEGDGYDRDDKGQDEGQEDKSNEYDDNHSKWKDHNDDDRKTSFSIDKSSSTTSSSYSTASSTWSTSWYPSSSSVPSVNVPSVGVPLAVPSPQPTLTPQRVSLLTSQVIKARQRAVDASHSQINPISSPSIWLSPHPGDAFQTGQEISLQWSSAPSIATADYQLRLCILKNTVDLQQAQAGSFDQGACGLAIPVNSSLVPSGLGWQISFAAPTVSAADSFFAILTSNQGQVQQQQGPAAPIGQAAFSLPPFPNRRNSAILKQRQTLSQIVSPSFVLAPRGIDLSLLNTLPSPSSDAAASPSVQLDQSQQSTTSVTTKTRSFHWAWVVLPIMVILIILTICGLVYCHRRGQRSARKLAEQESREGEEKWREATRKEVDSLAKSAADQAALYSSRPISVRSFAELPPRQKEIEACSIPLPSSPADPYTYLPSNLGLPSRRLQRNSTIYSSSSTIKEQLIPSIHPRASRKAVPYHEEENCKAWVKRVSTDGQSSLPLLVREPSCCSSASSYSQSSALGPTLPIPAALRPRTSVNKAEFLVNPHEATQSRPTSLPLISRNLYPSAPRSRILSSSAAELSATTGRIGTAYDRLDDVSIQRANQVNDLYLQLKQALQQPPTGNIII